MNDNNNVKFKRFIKLLFQTTKNVLYKCSYCVGV